MPPWLKYHASATDYAARMVRYGMNSRGEAQQMVREHDHKLAPPSVREFCDYSETEFWNIIDKLYNEKLFEKDSFGRWVLKYPVWKD